MDWYSMSDQAILEEIGSFIKEHRLQQNKTQGELAKEANISRSTLSLLEKGETGTVSILIQILRVLDQLHVLDKFHGTEQFSPLQLARLEQEKRQRARKSTSKEPKEESEW
ncbi:helix-turn-helix domain-containing protein [Reichenbachiella agariperforans]|uniref:helix-turn-helix domain-containing protein n=1 Tax=Reichenbachiella agariperforans TaxID=156994 RepID=UPI001C086AA4|nr:helix-turn-helix transcriptional regulator [Reichenbachiella agariperforans]MBU2915959.1 helix-turn-helix domain-containing protein [Reichenbachiella agariperforans]